MVFVDGVSIQLISSIFFFNDTATTEIYTLSLHDALPIWNMFRTANPYAVGFMKMNERCPVCGQPLDLEPGFYYGTKDRKSTRLNSSHANISYAVFCLKKKKMQSTWSPYMCHLHHSVFLED